MRLWCLHGQRRWNRRLWRRLARAPETVAGHPVARPLALNVAARSRQVRPEEAREPTWGTAKRALGPCCWCRTAT
eukprot:scaffold32792_cov59-Phaeocystis_antarctica.AAC.2